MKWPINMKRCSKLLVIREPKIKIILRYHFIHIETVKIKEADNVEHGAGPGVATSFNIIVTVKMYACLERLFHNFLES